MFRQIKSAIIWSYIYRFRSLLIKLVIALILIGFIEFIYRDIVEYLRLSQKLDYLIYVIVLKWFLILSIIFYLIYQIMKIGKKKLQKSDNKSINETQKITEMSKKEIRTMAQKIIEKKVKK